jgi:putative oxidoreductase
VTPQQPAAASSRSNGPALIARVLHWLDAVPYSLLAIPLRLAVATVFWNSAMTKLANWDTAVALFVDEYKVPLIPPEILAYITVSIELTTPVLLVLGLLTRPTAALLLGMTAVIEIFVYPLAWPTHIQWAAMLLVLLCRGPGKVSVDEWLRRRLFARLGTSQAASNAATDKAFQ